MSVAPHSAAEVKETYHDGLDEMRWLVAREDLLRLSKIQPGKVILHLSLTWAVVLLLLEAAIRAHSIWVDAVTFALIGCAQNALVLFTHEVSHYGLSRNKRLNDFLADAFVSGPMGVSVVQYRWQHFKHHRYLGNPDLEIDLTAWVCVRGVHLLSQIGRHLLGVYGLKVVSRYDRQKGDQRYATLPPRSLTSVLALAIGNGMLFTFCALQGCWHLYFVLWALPLFTVTLLIGNFRTIVEHQPSSDVCDTGLVRVPAVVRVVRSRLLERMLIAPVGFYYHLEHHLFPSVPYHRLREVRRFLDDRGCFQRPDIVWADGYFKTIWRLAKMPGYGVRVARPASGS